MSRQSTVPYIGSKISLVSNSEIRYEGILYTINTQESTIALQSVRCFGTEGRKVPEIPPSSEVYDFIIFRGQDIKDLTVLEAANAVNDPAIVSINQRPAGKGADGEKGSAGKAAPSKSAGQSISSMLSGNWAQQSAPHSQGYGKGSKDYQSGGSSGWGGWSNSWKDSWSGGGWGGEGGWGKSGSSYGKGGGGGGGKGSGGASYSKGATSRGWNGDAGKSGKASGKSGREGGKPGEKGKGGKASVKGSFDGKGAGKKRRGGGGKDNNGVPVGELVPEDNPEAKREFAEDFDYGAANDKFDKIIGTDDNLELEGVEERLKPLTGYDKSKSFFDSISCEATEHAANTDQKVDRDKARQFDRETFGDTRRPPRPTGARPGKGRQEMNQPPARIVAARWRIDPGTALRVM
mmetsp:Transcript_73719/g.140330  ORF Transcript_73719/g.140330 Transcript_73719/m.140330 type:complete len:405 (-) Transcript_73719:222-1436(-)